MSYEPDRVIADLRTLAERTGGPEGSRRLAWTPEWLEARALFRESLATLPVEIDTDGAFGVHTQAPNGTNFEPSGLVKGWAVQKSALLLEARGAANFTITAGGDLVLRGRPSPNTLWRVGIRHPEQTDQLAAVLHAEGPLAVATSALYERGQHIVDPRTDEPATSLASVTLIGPDLTFVDAYATAVFVMGLEEGLAWLDARHGDYGAFIITQDHLAYSTPVFDRYRAHPESPSCDELR